jgi:hypothetical protein
MHQRVVSAHALRGLRHAHGMSPTQGPHVLAAAERNARWDESRRACIDAPPWSSTRGCHAVAGTRCEVWHAPHPASRELETLANCNYGLTWFFLGAHVRIRKYNAGREECKLFAKKKMPWRVPRCHGDSPKFIREIVFRRCVLRRHDNVYEVTLTCARCATRHGHEA